MSSEDIRRNGRHFDELVIERYKHVQNDETDKEQCK